MRPPSREPAGEVGSADEPVRRLLMQPDGLDVDAEGRVNSRRVLFTTMDSHESLRQSLDACARHVRRQVSVHSKKRNFMARQAVPRPARPLVSGGQPKSNGHLHCRRTTRGRRSLDTNDPYT